MAVICCKAVCMVLSVTQQIMLLCTKGEPGFMGSGMLQEAGGQLH
jgi:hypothetical protein